MIATLHNESSASRILALVARCAPVLMRTGGGALSSEDITRSKAQYLTPEKRAQVLALGKAGKLTATEIAREVGSTQSAVFHTLERAGIKAPDGRAGRKSPRRARK